MRRRPGTRGCLSARVKVTGVPCAAGHDQPLGAITRGVGLQLEALRGAHRTPLVAGDCAYVEPSVGQHLERTKRVERLASVEHRQRCQGQASPCAPTRAGLPFSDAAAGRVALHVHELGSDRPVDILGGTLLSTPGAARIGRWLVAQAATRSALLLPAARRLGAEPKTNVVAAEDMTVVRDRRSGGRLDWAVRAC